MKKETDELNEKILESARSEFLAYGYQNASLRRICRAAGLTTGALYKRYESKDSLFVALLEPTLTALDQYGQEQKRRDYAFLEEGHLSDMWAHRLEDLQSLMRILYEHKDIMQLLLFKSQGSSQADLGCVCLIWLQTRLIAIWSWHTKRVRSIIWSNMSFCDRA